MLRRRIGAGQSVARVLESISFLAREERVEIAAIQPQVAEEGEVPTAVLELGPELSLRETPLTLSVVGTYRQVGMFLSHLTQGPFLASIRSLRLTKPTEGSSRLRADLAVSVYLAEQALSL
jgi:Tfp pilus assembly protein PilO